MIIIFIQSVLFVFQNRELQANQFLGALFLIMGVFGAGLIFHKQVGPYLTGRREIAALRHKTLKIVVRVVVVLGIVVTVGLDVWHVMQQSSG